jgi:methyl-accepting chemotaxis protein
LFLVVLTTLMAYTFIYKELVQFTIFSAAIADTNPIDKQSASSIQMSGFKLRILLLLSAGMLFIVFFSFIWLRIALRHIQRPIRIIQQAVFRLAQGNLNETVAIESTDEFGQIGSSINELAANLQELLLYIWKQTGQCVHNLERIRLANDPQISQQDLRELSRAIESLREMAKAYVFYDVHLDGEKALAINQPGQKEPDYSLPAQSTEKI